jgi:hypothetical protein
VGKHARTIFYVGAAHVYLNGIDPNTRQGLATGCIILDRSTPHADDNAGAPLAQAWELFVNPLSQSLSLEAYGIEHPNRQRRDSGSRVPWVGKGAERLDHDGPEL